MEGVALPPKRRAARHRVVHHAFGCRLRPL
jgi:hypothetical protein